MSSKRSGLFVFNFGLKVVTTMGEVVRSRWYWLYRAGDQGLLPLTM